MIKTQSEKRMPRALAAGAAALSALFGAALPAPAQALSRAEQEELAEGRWFAAAYEPYVLPANHPMSRRVRAIGSQFARLSRRRHIPYTYKVLDRGTYRTLFKDDKDINAFAVPGGPIYISLEYMNELRNDAELAAVLGHETAHTDRKHQLNRSKQERKAALKGLAVAALAGLLGKDQETRLGLGGVAAEAWKSRYSRKGEDEADAVGLRWMSQLGYDPRAAITEMRKFVEEERGHPRGPLGIEESHSSSEKRIATMWQQIQREHLLQVAARPYGRPRLSYGINFGRESQRSNGGYARVFQPQKPRFYVFQFPLRQVRVGRGSVLMAPAGEVTHWAGGRSGFSRDRRVFLIRHGRNVLELPASSATAYLNGRAYRMAGPPLRIGDELYVPFQTLIRTVGVTKFEVLDANKADDIVLFQRPGRLPAVALIR